MKNLGITLDDIKKKAEKQSKDKHAMGWFQSFNSGESPINGAFFNMAMGSASADGGIGAVGAVSEEFEDGKNMNKDNYFVEENNEDDITKGIFEDVNGCDPEIKTTEYGNPTHSFSEDWNEDDVDDYDGGGKYVYIRSKSVMDYDGFYTDYTMYYDVLEDKYVMVFGDRDYYSPDDGDIDAEFDDKEVAEEWFDNYNGFEDEDFDEGFKVDYVESADTKSDNPYADIDEDCAYDDIDYNEDGDNDIDESFFHLNEGLFDLGGLNVHRQLLTEAVKDLADLDDAFASLTPNQQKEVVNALNQKYSKDFMSTVGGGIRAKFRLKANAETGDVVPEFYTTALREKGSKIKKSDLADEQKKADAYIAKAKSKLVKDAQKAIINVAKKSKADSNKEIKQYQKTSNAQAKADAAAEKEQNKKQQEKDKLGAKINKASGRGSSGISNGNYPLPNEVTTALSKVSADAKTNLVNEFNNSFKNKDNNVTVKMNGDASGFDIAFKKVPDGMSAEAQTQYLNQIGASATKAATPLIKKATKGELTNDKNAKRIAELRDELKTAQLKMQPKKIEKIQKELQKLGVNESLKEGFIKDKFNKLADKLNYNKLISKIESVTTPVEAFRLKQEIGRMDDIENYKKNSLLDAISTKLKELSDKAYYGKPAVTTEALVEGVMSDLNIDLMDDKFIDKLKGDIDALQDELKFLQTQAPKEIKKGGAFDSQEEIDEAIDAVENALKVARAKYKIVINTMGIEEAKEPMEADKIKLTEEEDGAEETTENTTVDYKALFKEFMDDVGYFEDGVYTMYADYRDRIDPKAVVDILESDNPYDTFYDSLQDSYQYAEIETRDQIFKEFDEYLEDRGISADYDPAELDDLFSVDVDYDHYLDQEYQCRLVVDTGDSNYDFTLNPAYHNDYHGNNGETNDNKIGKPASLVWLAETQGYSVEDLRKVLDGEETSSKFLKSVYREAINTTSSMNTITFLCTASLADLLEQHQDKTAVRLDKSVVCGLFDSWNGGGSVLDIELEKEVTIPDSIIREFVPDESSIKGYSVDEVYGLSGSVYDTEAVIA